MGRKMSWILGIVLASGVLSSPCRHIEAAMPSRVQDALVSGFLHPPDAAKPRIWWHWINGNITEAGIKLDLEWMSRIGLGGVQTFDAAIGTPKIVDQRVVFMKPPWKDAVRFAATTAANWDWSSGLRALRVGVNLGALG